MHAVRAITIALLVGLVAVAGHGAVQAGSNQFTTLTDPNAAVRDVGGTLANGINEQGDIVGYYADSTHTGHGFLLHQGVYTTLNDPKAGQGLGTYPADINAQGDVVGAYTAIQTGKTTFAEHSFLLHQGTYTTFDDPKAGAHGSTAASGINDHGAIVGSYDRAKSVRGFLLHRGKYSTIDDPRAKNSTLATDINNAGDIVGYYSDSHNVSHGFLLHHGTYTPLNDPKAGRGGGQGTFAHGINDRGDIVGWYTDSKGTWHGFLLHQGMYTTLNHPEAGYGTSAQAINQQGTIVGDFADSQGISHGFLWGPAAVPTR